MFIRLGSISLYLGVLSAIFVFLVQWKLKYRFTSLVNWIKRLNILTATLIWASFISLAILFVQSDFSVVPVYLYSDLSMTTIEKLMATWASRQGVMILWAAIMATIAVLTYNTVENDLENPIVNKFATIILFFSALIASFTMSTRPAAFDTQPIVNDGVGLTPSLLSFWQQLHPPVAFLAYSAFIVPFAYGLSMLYYNTTDYAKPNKLHRINDIYILIGWLTTTLFIVAGSIWGYEENWAGFWNWDPVEVAALIMWVVGTLYFHVKSQVSDNHVLKYTIAALGWVAVAFASFVVRSGILQGQHSYAGLQLAPIIVFGILLLGSLSGLGFAVWKSNENLFPDYLYNWSLHRNKPKFLTFWSLVGLVVVNTIGIVMQIFNALAFDIQEYPYEYYIYLNGLLLFVTGVLLVYCELDFMRYGHIKIYAAWGILAIVFGILYYFLLIDSMMTLIMVTILTAALILLVVHMINSIGESNFRKFRVQLTHVLVLLLLISYIAVDYNTEVERVSLDEGESVTIDEFDITISATRRLEGASYFIDLVVSRDNEILDRLVLSHGIHDGSQWTRGDWTINPFYDLFFLSEESNLYSIRHTDPIPIAVKKVPMANFFRILFILFVIVTPISIMNMIQKLDKSQNNLPSDN